MADEGGVVQAVPIEAVHLQQARNTPEGLKVRKSSMKRCVSCEAHQGKHQREHKGKEGMEMPIRPSRKKDSLTAVVASLTKWPLPTGGPVPRRAAPRQTLCYGSSDKGVLPTDGLLICRYLACPGSPLPHQD